ncbi:MAG: hypothetical protein NVS9B10_29030 [Nevskia sp.]
MLSDHALLERPTRYGLTAALRAARLAGLARLADFTHLANFADFSNFTDLADFTDLPCLTDLSGFTDLAHRRGKLLRHDQRGHGTQQQSGGSNDDSCIDHVRLLIEGLG